MSWSAEVLPLPENWILQVEVGSTAHGTGLPGGEDHDETVVVVETAEQVLGLSGGLKNRMQRTKAEGERSGPGDIDRQIYSLRNFLGLCTSGNPSIQLALYAPVLDSGVLGSNLRKLAPAFVGRHVIPRYRGYMNSQLMRLKGLKGNGHGKRGGGKREELIAEHGFDTKFAMHAARLGFQCIELMENGCLELPVKGWIGDWLRDLRGGRISQEDFEDMVEALDLKMDRLMSNEDIRPTADRAAIEKFSVETHGFVWKYGVL